MKSKDALYSLDWLMVRLTALEHRFNTLENFILLTLKEKDELGKELYKTYLEFLKDIPKELDNLKPHLLSENSEELISQQKRFIEEILIPSFLKRIDGHNKNS